jgi:hypothetical protein
MNRVNSYGMSSIKLWTVLQYCEPIIFYPLYSNRVDRYYFKTFKYLCSLK